MRHVLALLATTTLAACGGAGPTTAGGSAAPSGAGGSGSGSGAGSGHTFVTPTEVKTYQAIGGAQNFEYTTDETRNYQYDQLYAGDATAVRNSGISVTYNPRDAIFEVNINQPTGLVTRNERYQDPLHRTDFGGAVEPQLGVPDLTSRGYRFLEAGTSSVTADGLVTYDRYSFFYQRPGTTTDYVTLAGYVRNSAKDGILANNSSIPQLKVDYELERAVMVYGERTNSASIPTNGTGTFAGELLASMVFNPLVDTDPTSPTYFQWISGTSTTQVNFGTNSFSLNLAGTVTEPAFDRFTSGSHVLGNGSSFTAVGAGNIDLVAAGGFVGRMSSASFVTPGGTRYDVNIAGSSIDGTFFGPSAKEVGGGFRIVGGTPDERIDILGAFTGKR